MQDRDLPEDVPDAVLIAQVHVGVQCRPSTRRKGVELSRLAGSLPCLLYDGRHRQIPLHHAADDLFGLVAETGGVVDREASTFWIHLIPETLRVTTLGEADVGTRMNIEVDAMTQAVVDTVERVLAERGVVG